MFVVDGNPPQLPLGCQHSGTRATIMRNPEARSWALGHVALIALVRRDAGQRRPGLPERGRSAMAAELRLPTVRTECTKFAWIGDMTYGDALALPRGTRVRMADGSIGRIVSWQHSTESIVVRLDDDGPVTVRAAELHSTLDGWTAGPVPPDA